MEVEPFGVRVVIIQPGIIKTEFEDQTAAQLRQYSGDGAYRHMAEAMAREAATGLAGGSDPAVIAQAIRAAVESDHPETRYAVGAMAEQLLQLNRKLPDREFDKLATRAIR
jgi:NAD(P)-dependent dehydrogenase (short-subunit alcohol dehydrogenase family)